MALAGAMVVIACVLAGSWGLLRGMRREAQLNALQSHFIAAVSHELRTPVTSLRYMADMLGAQRVAQESLAEYYAVLGRESRRLQSLIEGLLQFGRLEAGTTRLQRDRIDAWQFVTTTVQDFETTRDGAGPRARIVGTDPGVALLGDEPALAVALRNLLDNAVNTRQARRTSRSRARLPMTPCVSACETSASG
jgi:two-component system phosphate regulon sensor histidine kinase PhoR